MRTAVDHVPSLLVPARVTSSGRPGATVTASALVAGLLASLGLGTSPVAAMADPNALSAAAIAPGTIFAANPGAGGTGTGPGYITMYRPGASGNARPEATITAGIDDPSSLTFDPTGDLWVSNETTATAVEYSKAELAKASPVPTITISADASGDFSIPWGITFDPSGDIWLADNGTSSLMEFTTAELAKSGSPAPRVTISPNISSNSLSGPCQPALDSSGDLWTGNYNLSNVVEFTKAVLAKSGSPAARVTISSKRLFNSCRPVFDSAGDLWIASFGLDNVVEFTKAELAKSGSPAPKVIISSTGAVCGDVVLDPSGNLWVPDQNGSVVEYTKAELAKSGSPTPARIIAGAATGLKGDWAVAVEP
jgi:NHL repeat